MGTIMAMAINVQTTKRKRIFPVFPGLVIVSAFESRLGLFLPAFYFPGIVLLLVTKLFFTPRQAQNKISIQHLANYKSN
jgi:hypothetical protein